MKKYFWLIVLCLLSPIVVAASNGIYPGQNQSVGNLADPHSIFVAQSNPANAGLALAENKRLRINFSPTLWSVTELGDVDNFIDDLDDLIDLLDDSSNSDEPIEETLDRFNSVLESMGENGYLKTSIGVSAPLLPVYIRVDPIDAVFYSDFSYGTTVGMRILDDELVYDPQNSGFATNTSAYVKSSVETRLGAGLSKLLYTLNYSMQLYGGVKFNFIQMALSKQIIALQQMNGESIEDVVSDAYDDHLETSTNIGIDLGLRLAAEKYSLGLTVTDINSPQFNYGAVGIDCDTYADASAAYANCETARYFSEVMGEIVAREKYTRNALAIIDGYYQINKTWFTGFELESAAYDDTVGTENQWLNIGAGYQSAGKIPSFRFGYRQNMAGSELGSLNVGTTLFGMITMDISWSLDSVDVDGTRAPRMFGGSIGVQQRF